MSEILAKRARDIDPLAIPAPKRSKKVDSVGLATALNPANTGGVEGGDVLKRAEAAQARCFAAYQSAFAGVIPSFTPDYVHAAIRDTVNSIEISKLAKDTGEKYEREEKRLEELEKAVRENENRLKMQEDASNKFRNESLQRQAQKRDEISALRRTKSSEEDRLKGEIDRLRQQLKFYSLLSNTEISPEGANTYLFRVSLHQNEFSFRLKVLGDHTVDYELKSFSVPAARVPEVLTQAINVDQKDVPDLLLKVLNALI